MWDRLTRLKTYCSEHRESVAATLFYAAFVTGLALLSVPWALAIGGGVGLAVMLASRAFQDYLSSRDEAASS